MQPHYEQKSGWIPVVDDGQRISSLNEAHLQLHGFRADLGGNDAEAVESFQPEPAEQVRLDLMLPRLDGFGAWRLCEGSGMCRC